MGRHKSFGIMGPKLQFGSDPSAPPPGPWNQPPPPGPPTGTMAPDSSYYPPPAPPRKAFPWGMVLGGCGVLLVIALVVGGVCSYTLYKKGSDVVSTGMDFAKSAYLNQLSSDHSSEQRQRFESLLNAVWTDERNRLGFAKWSTEYQPIINNLTMISSDQSITVEESTDWCDKAYYTLEKNGYWGEGDSEKAPDK
jgi:hypothetical protein